ncbi:MAG: hypothetical protein AAF386_07500, partial [Pseudomonadota bacterium]
MKNGNAVPNTIQTVTLFASTDVSPDANLVKYQSNNSAGMENATNIQMIANAQLEKAPATEFRASSYSLVNGLESPTYPKTT